MTPSMMTYFGEMTPQRPRIRLSVLGAKGVGKTAIIVRYLTRRFIGEYRSQIDITYRNAIRINDKETNVEIIDFSSKNEEDRIPDLESSLADCYLVVYSISDRVSFLKAVNIVCVLRALSSSAAAPVTLIGNKKDLDHSRQVSIDELHNIATLFMCELAEVSAAETTEEIIPVISNLFHTAFELVKKRDEDSSAKRKTLSECKSEPSLLQKNKLSTGVNQRRKRERSLDNTADQSHCSLSGQRNLDNSADSDRCSSCSQHHERSSSYSKASNSPRSVRKRKTHKPPHARSYSLNYKDHKSKSEPKFLLNKTRESSSLSTSDSITEHAKLSKKDSKISDFLNCSKTTENESDSFSYCHQRNPKSECTTTSVSSFWLRGRSFTNENSKVDRKKFSSFRSPNSINSSKNCATPTSSNTLIINLANSRKSQALKFFSSDVSGALSNKVTDVKSKTISINAMKPPIKRTSKSLLEPPQGPTSSRTVEDRLSNFMKKKSSTITESTTFLSLMNKASEPAKDSQLPSYGQPLEKRERKFGVFGINALTNVFSKTSLPDLPKATASLYTKFGSFKNTIKKRSV